MAMEDEEERLRRRRREAEDERDTERLKANPTPGKPLSDPTGDKFIELIERAEPMIEQLNTLYNMYAAGAEKLPPTERRKQLDQTMTALQMLNKGTLANRFRYNSVQNRYQSHCERWDRMMKSLEGGRVKNGHSIIGLTQNFPTFSEFDFHLKRLHPVFLLYPACFLLPRLPLKNPSF